VTQEVLFVVPLDVLLNLYFGVLSLSDLLLPAEVQEVVRLE
jgi:hypothetical protein